MKPTEQQEHCVELSKTEKIIKIVAIAGAGKTSTLKLTAAANAVKSLYMAFNKVTAEEAKVGFPSYVTAKTTHSIAYAQFGQDLQHKLKRPTGAYKNVAGTPSEIARYYKIGAAYSPFTQECIMTASGMGMLIRDTVARFEQSADDKIEDKHVPFTDAEKLRKNVPHELATILKTARLLWKDRINKSSEVLATHDTYLKLYQLSKPKLDYEIIYVDEFQDTTPCVLDIVKQQMNHARIVVVGDPRQAIYGWRGAINAMELIEAPEAILSKSFRYGQGVADIAAQVLQNTVDVKGRDDLICKVGTNVVDRTKPYMYLFRTNGALIYEAVGALANGEDIKIEIDVRDFIRVLESAQALFNGNMKDVKHDLIVPYPDWKTLAEEAKEVTGELKRIQGIVESGDVARFIRVLTNYEAPAGAVKIFTTAHKAKGRESEQVILAEDFPSPYKEGEYVGLSFAEENLLYVAVTRAMLNLELNSTVYEIINWQKSNQTEHMFKKLGFSDYDMEIAGVKPKQDEYQESSVEKYEAFNTGRATTADMATFTNENLEREESWRQARRAEGLSEAEIDELDF